MRIEYHRTLIADRVRNAAFEAALRTVIKKGVTTVADIGTGTGLLALMAVKLGAREVFLYEAAEVASVAAKVLKANGARNCHLIPCHSTEMVDPPKVDVVVSETLGNYAFEEHIIETLNDAKKRFLKPGGVLIPRRIEQFVAPVVSARIHDEFDAWDATGFDLSVARTMSLNNIYVRTLAANELLEAQGVGRRRPRQRRQVEPQGRGKLEAQVAGDGLRLCHVVERRAGARHLAVDGAGCAAHALGAALLSAAPADRGQSRRNDRRQSTLAHLGRCGHARCLGSDASRRQGPRNGAPVAQSR